MIIDGPQLWPAFFRREPTLALAIPRRGHTSAGAKDLTEPLEPEIIQLNVQRAGMEKIRLRAALTAGLSDACQLVIAWPVGSEERHFDGPDYYECLRAFRRVIEPDGFRVLCQGARPNVCPSAMASEMGGAMKSYVLTLGLPAFTKDLVGTFDPVEDIASVGTLQEQDEFMRRHWEEFKKRARSIGK